MLRMHTSYSAAQAKDYFTESLSRGDYYRKGQEMPGRWGGLAALQLGLSGDVKQRDFFDLCDNKVPGKRDKLTPRTKDGRRVGYDINFHVPKSVTLMYALGQDRRILSAFRESVSETMQDLEKVMRTRVRVDGQRSDRVTGNMAWAEFVHTTSRPVGGIPDPHLHAHCFTFNVTNDPVEGRFKAGEFEQLKRNAGLCEARFHVRMAERMVALGYGVVQKGKFWEIAGISPELTEKFSRRTSEINKLAEDLGIQNDPERKAGLGARTREKKQKSDTFEELQKEWHERAGDEGMREIRSAKNTARPSSEADRDKAAKQAVAYAILHSFERKSAVPERELREVAMRRVTGKSSVDRIDAAFATQPLIRRTFNRESWVTTKEVLAEEQRMVAFATETRGRCSRIIDGVYEVRDKSLTKGQTAAVRHILNSYDQVMLIRGGAGTGKTRLMTEAITAMKAAGHKVIVLAPLSDVARQTLPKEGFNDAETIAKFLVSNELQERFKKGIIWVDEAGLVGTRTMTQLFDVVGRNKCRVVVSGDDMQHKSIERGDSIRVMVHEGGMQSAEIRGVIRQKGEYKEACEQLNRGEIDAGWKTLTNLGFIVELKGDRAITDAHDGLAGEYAQALKSRKTVLAISPTLAEGEQVTKAIRAKLKEEGIVGRNDREMMRLKPLNFTEAQKADASNYRAGMFVEFHQKSRGKKATERGEVIGTKAGLVLIKGVAGIVTPLVLKLSDARKFSVYEKETMPLAVGDTIRITRNGKAAGDLLGFLPDRRNPLRSVRQLGREMAESLGISEKQFRPRERRLNNGAIYRVIGILPLSGDIVLNNGWVVGKNFGHISHGYCSTSPGAQSKTVDRVLIAQTSQSFGPASNAEQLLVSVSRGRESCSLYTDNQEKLLEHVKKSGERMSATAMVRSSEAEMREHSRLAREQAERQRDSEQMKERGRDHER